MSTSRPPASFSLTFNLSVTLGDDRAFEPRARWIILALAALALLSRDPSRLLDAQLWAEDGVVWFHDAYTGGIASLAWAHSGYLQTYPRLIALLACLAPLTWLPTLFILAGFAAQIAPVALLLTAGGRGLIPSTALRLLMIVFYIGMPNSYEVYLNLTDAQWHVAIVGFLLIVLPVARGWAGRRIAELTLAVAGLSGPYSIFLAPIAWVRLWEERREALRFARLLQVAIVSATAAIQIFCLIQQAVSTRHLTAALGASMPRFARILDDQILLGGLLGIRGVSRIVRMPVWSDGDLLPMLWLAFCLMLIGVAIATGSSVYRKFLAFAAALMAGALIAPLSAPGNSAWAYMVYPGIGCRYYMMPILAWFATLLVLAGGARRFFRDAAWALIALSVLGVVADWRYGHLLPTAFEAQAAAFDRAPRGTTALFNEAPTPNWVFTLTKK